MAIFDGLIASSVKEHIFNNRVEDALHLIHEFLKIPWNGCPETMTKYELAGYIWTWCPSQNLYFRPA